MNDFNREEFIKSLEDDNASDIENDDDIAEELNFDFSPEQIKEAINNVISEINPTFVSIFDVSIFLGNVAKKLTSTLKNESIPFDVKYKIILQISQTVVNELEQKGLIDIEMASEFKSSIKEGEQYKDVVGKISSFFTSPPDVKHKLIMNTLDGLLNRFLK
jgi:hypothetical protein